MGTTPSSNLVFYGAGAAIVLTGVYAWSSGKTFARIVGDGIGGGIVNVSEQVIKQGGRLLVESGKTIGEEGTKAVENVAEGVLQTLYKDVLQPIGDFSRTRGAGVVPNIKGHCPPDRPQKDAGLCYRKCPRGYKGVGPVCWQMTYEEEVEQWKKEKAFWDFAQYTKKTVGDAYIREKGYAKSMGLKDAVVDMKGQLSHYVDAKGNRIEPNLSNLEKGRRMDMLLYNEMNSWDKMNRDRASSKGF